MLLFFSFSSAPRYSIVCYELLQEDCFVLVVSFILQTQYVKDGGKLEDLKFRLRLFPFVPILCIVNCASLFVFATFDPTQRVSLALGFDFIGLC